MQLCGDDTLKNIVIVTTMWSEVAPSKGAAREVQLKTNDKFFKPALDKQAQMLRHDNTIESAQAILQTIMHNHPIPLKVQEEVVDQNKPIGDTDAAHELNREIEEKTRQFESQIRKLQQEMNDAITQKDEEQKEILAEQRKDLEERLRRERMDQEKLMSNFKKSNEELEAKMQEMQKQYDEERSRLERQLSYAKTQDEVDRLKAELVKLQDQGFFGQIGKGMDSAVAAVGRGVDNAVGAVKRFFS
jgi:chromosome segregation ATPase